MKNQIPSRTALTTSLIRAHHTRTSRCPIHIDPWGDLLVPDEFKRQLVQWHKKDSAHAQADSAPGFEADLDSYLTQVPSYASVVLRARFSEDALEQHVQLGVRQYVQVGAGFDSYSLRKPSELPELAVFEIDHPATQTLKIKRILDATRHRPPPPTYIAADLSSEGLVEALIRSPFSFAQPAFFSWLGVTIYLTLEDNLSTLRSIAKCGAPGSRLVFTYTDQAILGNPNLDADFLRMLRNAASMSEPFLTGFDPREIGRILHSCGLELLEDLDGHELGVRYSLENSQNLHAPRYSRIALARVPV